MPTDSCPCMTPRFDRQGFERRYLGVDELSGRFGEVTIETCRRCGQRWLHYFYEIEGFPSSGRWYRGTVSEEQVDRATAGNALRVLGTLSWHFAGGSSFGSEGTRIEAPRSATP